MTSYDFILQKVSVDPTYKQEKKSVKKVESAIIEINKIMIILFHNAASNFSYTFFLF